MEQDWTNMNKCLSTKDREEAIKEVDDWFTSPKSHKVNAENYIEFGSDDAPGEVLYAYCVVVGEREGGTAMDILQSLTTVEDMRKYWKRFIEHNATSDSERLWMDTRK